LTLDGIWGTWLLSEEVSFPSLTICLPSVWLLVGTLFLTPKIVNLIVSGIAVIAVYFLGRELFGRTAGFLTASLFAFLPWHVWLGISGLTSDLPSVVLIALFGLFFFRWLETDQPRALLAAAGYLFVANGFRYENWLFSLIFSLLIISSTVSCWRQGRLDRQSLTVAICSVTIINAFPIIWMAAFHSVSGSWLPALQTNALMVLRIQLNLRSAISAFPFWPSHPFPLKLSHQLGVSLCS
jgi:uncharacterized membrane protein